MSPHVRGKVLLAKQRRENSQFRLAGVIVTPSSGLAGSERHCQKIHPIPRVRKKTVQPRQFSLWITEWLNDRMNIPSLSRKQWPWAACGRVFFHQSDDYPYRIPVTPKHYENCNLSVSKCMTDLSSSGSRFEQYFVNFQIKSDFHAPKKKHTNWITYIVFRFGHPAQHIFLCVSAKQNVKQTIFRWKICRWRLQSCPI